jgi:AmiR/NasT family two-component response regulator
MLDPERSLERYLEFLEASLSEAAVREVQLAESGRIRDLIGQAKGILMEREGATADQALELLTSCARHLNLKLREVAALVVADTLSTNKQASSETA